LIDNGEGWLEPMLRFRNMLAETQIPDQKHRYREYKRRNGRVFFKRGGGIARGPYKLDFRRNLLKQLLEVQVSVQKTEPNLSLISDEELVEIRRLWRHEEGDWQDSVPIIYREVCGKDLQWSRDDAPVFSEDDGKLLEEICQENDLPPRLVTKLLDLERELQGMGRRASIFTRVDSILKEEWRSEEEVLKALEN